MKLTIPTDISEVTIKQYQAYRRIPNEVTGKERYEAVLRAVAVGADKADFSQVTLRKLKDAAFKCEKVMYQEMVPLQKLVEIDGLTYGLNPNLSECTAIEYAEAMDLQTEGDEQLHNLMQVFYRPLTRLDKKGSYRIENYEYSKERAKLFQNKMTMDVVFGCYVFFSSILLTYNSETQQYSSRAAANPSMN